jgi:hypothetical protein
MSYPSREPRSVNPIGQTTTSKQGDIDLTKVEISRYTNYRVKHLPDLFAIPLSALANSLLPQTMHHRVLFAMLIGFGIGVPMGELSRYIWLYKIHKRR